MTLIESGFPLSFAQQRLWFLDQLESGTAAYNLVRAFRITGPLDVDALHSALRAVIHRHESLRTIFEGVEGSARQVVLSQVDVPLPVTDVSYLPKNQQEAAALRIASEEGKKIFDLTRGPLFRTLLVRLRDDQHLLVLAMHHIIIDGWSISILFREIARAYEASVAGREPDFPELSLQYVEYAQWQREYIQGELLAKQTAYWKNKLAGAQTTLDLPTDHPRPSTHSWHGATEELILDDPTLIALKRLAQQEGATLFMVSMAAIQALLWRYTGQESILVGTPTASRNQVEIENLIGFFVNTLVFRADISDGLTFRDLICQVRDCALEAYSHQDVPFEKLVEELAPERSMDTTPLFQVMFTFQNIPKQIFEIAGLEMKELEFETGIAKFDLSVEMYEDHGLHCRFEYNTDLFEKSRISRLIEHFYQLVTAILKDPNLQVSHIPLMTAREREQAITRFNNTSAEDSRNFRIHTAFELEAAHHPDSIALRFEDKELTYRELNESANRAARLLVAKGIGTGQLAGMFFERSPEMVVALLAVLKAGAAYVPFDPAHPLERLRFMIEDAGVQCVLTRENLRAKLPATIQTVIALDTEAERINEESTNLGLEAPEIDRAYVLYTSGSTGRPKGVEGTHRGAINRFQWMWEQYPFQSDEVCCMKTNLSFVDSVWEIFGPLLAGVPNVIIPQETVLDPEELLNTLAKHGVTRMVLVPSLLRALLDHAPKLGERVPRLKWWTSSGEQLTAELAQRFRQAHPGATLLNIYGSSEVAADVSCHEVTERDQWVVPIGKPIRNTQIYVLDPHRNPVPIGVRGEIYVGGEGVARGYWNRPELTAEKFVRNQIAPELSERLYRTGDVGRWREDGELEYVGRVDREVKLRGMRVELGEIETVLVGEGGIREAAVELEEQGGEVRLVAYLTLRAGEQVEARELRRRMRGKVPEHMVPSRYVVLEELPLLASGKVNRRALKEMKGEVLAERGELAAPTNEVERKLVEVWKELLKIEEVGTEQNFFEMGGHSLLVLQVMARIRRTFGVELPVRTLFEEPTIAGLAEAVEKAEAEGKKARMPVLERRPRANAAASREALLAQLDQLSADDVQTLLKQVLEGKQPAQVQKL